MTYSYPQLRTHTSLRRDQRGQTMIIMAFLSIFLLLLVGLVIDSIRLRILTAQAERVAEAGALAGVIYMPDYYDTPSPDGTDALQRVCLVTRENGITTCPAGLGQVGAVPSAVSGNPNELQVTVTLTADVFFLSFLSPSFSSATISRTATAQYLPPLTLGSRGSAFGDEADGVQSFWARVNGPYSLKERGDAYTPIWEEGPTDPVTYPDASAGIYSFNRWSPPPPEKTNHPQWPSAIPNPDQHQPGFTGAKGTPAYNYEIVVPPGVGGIHVQIYNPAFDPPTDAGLDPACDDPTFNTGGCKTDQANEYLQMTYSLYSVPLSFERSADTLLTSFSPLSLDLIPGDNTMHACNVPTRAWDPQAQQCVPEPAYVNTNRWYTLYTITSPGTYRLAVETTGFYGAHEYSVKLTNILGNTPPNGVRVWAWNEMCVVFDITSTDAKFDLSEIPAAYAGKTLNFNLFDPGDGSGTIYLRILDPGGNPVQFPSWVRTVSGSGGTKIDASGGYYNSDWLHIPITIPATYNPAPPNDWWQLEYLTSGTPDDTISVNISLNGNPVHLVE